jgi:hypothetical protein
MMPAEIQVGSGIGCSSKPRLAERTMIGFRDAVEHRSQHRRSATESQLTKFNLWKLRAVLGART